MLKPFRRSAAKSGAARRFATLASRAGVLDHQPQMYLLTGTPAAQARLGAEELARERNTRIYHLDLSRIASKFLAETEKNLDRALIDAKSSGAILFFDEADALFGKRSDVRDSHDSYANQEIGFLLQRLERYSGTVVMATASTKPPRLPLSRMRVITTRWPP